MQAGGSGRKRKAPQQTLTKQENCQQSAKNEAIQLQPCQIIRTMKMTLTERMNTPASGTSVRHTSGNPELIDPGYHYPVLFSNRLKAHGLPAVNITGNIAEKQRYVH